MLEYTSICIIENYLTSNQAVTKFIQERSYFFNIIISHSHT